MNAPGSALLPSLAVAASAVFWGTTWIPLREIDGPGVPAEWSGLLIYLVPALLVLPTEGGSAEYCGWIVSETSGAEPR